MNPRYLWVTEMLTFFVVGPATAIVVAYAGWRGKRRTLSAKRHGMVCVACGVTGSVLLILAKWINADVRTPQYFAQLTCVLLGFFCCLWEWGPTSLCFYIFGAGTRRLNLADTSTQMMGVEIWPFHKGEPRRNRFVASLGSRFRLPVFFSLRRR
jgi:hypothetical protein